MGSPETGEKEAGPVSETSCAEGLATKGLGALRAAKAKFVAWLTCLGAGTSSRPAPPADPPSRPSSPCRKKCSACGRLVEEFGRGSRGTPLCRTCIRQEDEERLAPFTDEERDGLDLVSKALDSVSWRYWKPGEQPAQLLDWLYLGDLREVLDMQLLANKGINAVLNLINWWELTALLPEDTDLQYVFSTQDILYQEVDSEDRLFFKMLDCCWPAAEAFLERCRNEGRHVIVNCAAGHNRSACIAVCWLLMREKMTLLGALEHVQHRRGTILSNHGFRLQLVRLALQQHRLGKPSTVTKFLSNESEPVDDDGFMIPRIVSSKRHSAKYTFDSQDLSQANATAQAKGLKRIHTRKSSSISGTVHDLVSQRKLSMELLACLVHWNKNFLEDYEHTSQPPTVVGSGFSGDVVLCRRKGSDPGDLRGRRCVKRFHHSKMVPDHLAKLMNEAVIYLSLEHPLVARLFDVYEDEDETSLIMQYCAGGTLEDVLVKSGAFSEKSFQDHAVQMLRVVSYIHRMGIVHRDIKPRNWVYEADKSRVKLIDFGFSVKKLIAGDADGNGFGSLTGCMGTLGYLAPEVVHDRLDAGYTEKCDIWSLGVVFFELLTAEHAFHRERGTCEGYTQEVTLREIEEVTEEALEKLLRRVPASEAAKAFLRRMLTKDPNQRPSAQELLGDPFLAEARAKVGRPKKCLRPDEVLQRFRAYGEASAPTRASMLAMARSPTRLPWSEFVVLRSTFDLFDLKDLTGVVNLEAFLEVVAPEGTATVRDEARRTWEAVCGEQESLSYCEFLAALLPPIEDAFEDELCEPHSPKEPTPTALTGGPRSWDMSMPIAAFLSLLEPKRLGRKSVGDMIFNEDTPVIDVVRVMIRAHFRWVVVRYNSGRHEFFDYMDVNHRLLMLSKRMDSGSRLASAMTALSSMPVGLLANCSGYCQFVPVGPDTCLRDILKLISGSGRGNGGRADVHRVPIVKPDGEVIEVFSCLSFLELAMRFPGPRAVLKSRGARIFDCRDTIMEVSVQHENTVLNGLQVMDVQHLTICPATSRELAGDLGGVVAVGVISVSDLKWVVHTGNFGILDSSISDFIAWRNDVSASAEPDTSLQRSTGRYKCVSVDAEDSLYALATKLLSSRLQRIFLSSEEIARIVGIVSSRDILVEVFGELELQSSLLDEQVTRSSSKAVLPPPPSG